MSEHKLKPCPFCGSTAKLEELGDHHGNYFNLGCSNEKCPANNMFYTWTEEEGSVEDAVALWDRRDDAAVKALVEAAKVLLARDEINTCRHEQTYRGGCIWEICSECGDMWADDRGGKPKWQDPPEWISIRQAIEKVEGL